MANKAEVALKALVNELPYPTFYSRPVYPNGRICSDYDSVGLPCESVGNGDELYNQLKAIGKNERKED